LVAPRGRPAILNYHRIAEQPFDPWGLCVSPENFRAQIALLKIHRRMMSVDDLVTALRAGAVPDFAAAVTFDDGYADNALYAKPVLEEFQVPATFFLTSGAIGQGQFWWDELALLVLAGREPQDFEIEVGGRQETVQLDRQETLPPDLAGWRAEHGGNDQRRSAYLRLWALLQQSSVDARDEAMAKLRGRFGGALVIRPTTPDLPMTHQMVRDLPSPMISPGGHGRTHVPLAGMPPEWLHREIAGSRADIAALAGGPPPRGFAYPHGNMDPLVRSHVIEAGYSWAVVTDDLPINPRRFDIYALPRVTAGNWAAQTLLGKLR